LPSVESRPHIPSEKRLWSCVDLLLSLTNKMRPASPSLVTIALTAKLLTTPYESFPFVTHAPPCSFGPRGCDCCCVLPHPPSDVGIGSEASCLDFFYRQLRTPATPPSRKYKSLKSLRDNRTCASFRASGLTTRVGPYVIRRTQTIGKLDRVTLYYDANGRHSRGYFPPPQILSSPAQLWSSDPTTRTPNLMRSSSRRSRVSNNNFPPRERRIARLRTPRDKISLS